MGEQPVGGVAEGELLERPVQAREQPGQRAVATDRGDALGCPGRGNGPLLVHRAGSLEARLGPGRRWLDPREGADGPARGDPLAAARPRGVAARNQYDGAMVRSWRALAGIWDCGPCMMRRTFPLGERALGGHTPLAGPVSFLESHAAW